MFHDSSYDDNHVAAVGNGNAPASSDLERCATGETEERVPVAAVVLDQIKQSFLAHELCLLARSPRILARDSLVKYSYLRNACTGRRDVDTTTAGDVLRRHQ